MATEIRDVALPIMAVLQKFRVPCRISKRTHDSYNQDPKRDSSLDNSPYSLLTSSGMVAVQCRLTSAFNEPIVSLHGLGMLLHSRSEDGNEGKEQKVCAQHGECKGHGSEDHLACRFGALNSIYE